MASSDHYGHELRAQLAQATARGQNHILINVRDLQASFADLTRSNRETINCRLAMRSEMNLTDVLLVAEDNAAGMTVLLAFLGVAIAGQGLGGLV